MQDACLLPPEMQKEGISALGPTSRRVNACVHDGTLVDAVVPNVIVRVPTGGLREDS